MFDEILSNDVSGKNTNNWPIREKIGENSEKVSSNKKSSNEKGNQNTKKIGVKSSSW